MTLVRFMPIALGLVLVGCADTADYLRSQPVTYFPANESNITVPGNLKGTVALRCMKFKDIDDGKDGTPSAEFGMPSEKKGNNSRECLYVSADTFKLSGSIDGLSGTVDGLSGTVDFAVRRDEMISFLMGLSDINCSNFLHRAFANKAGLDFANGLLSNITTGASAGAAFSSPVASAALSASNLVVGKGIDSFNSTYYYDKTFQAMESAIEAERIRIKTSVLAKQKLFSGDGKLVKYSFGEAVSDVRKYDDACSIKAGLAQLIQIADARKKDDEKTKFAVELGGTADAIQSLVGKH